MILSNILIIVGIILILYFVGIQFFVITGSNFYMIFLAMGIGCLLFGLLFRNQTLMNKIPVWVKQTFCVLLIIGVLCFVSVELLILGSFHKKAEPNLPYVVVLGAQVWQNGPSLTLKNRLDCAYAYLIENEETKVVVSGGQGADEPMTEAESMQQYLINRGIESERIILEDRSTNTAENLAFSRKLIPEDITRIGVVTTNFHVFRGVQIAKKAGFTEAEGMAAEAYPYTLPNNMFREFFGVVKDIVMRNM